MEPLGIYQIDLKNLSSDSCEYTYSLDDAFFAGLSASEIQKGNLNVSLEVKKIQKAFKLCFHIEGFVFVPCDRCLQDLRQDVNVDEEINVRFGAVPSEDDDLIVVSEEEGIIDVACLIYEFIVLQLPMVRMHAEGECDESMMETLSKHLCIVEDDMPFPDAEEKEHGETDPRWDRLREILNDN